MNSRVVPTIATLFYISTSLILQYILYICMLKINTHYPISNTLLGLWDSPISDTLQMLSSQYLKNVILYYLQIILYSTD